MGLFPQSIEEYVPEDAPVRAYDAFVEALDLEALGIGWDECQVGPPEYDPKAMLKLLLYGYSYGVRSSRKLEREAHYNISFIWLLGGLKPDHKTIAEFRRRNKGALKGVLKQCARLCLKLGLIEGNTLFIDSMKIRGNASLKATWTKERCERAIEAMDERIGELLAECERIDEEEVGHPSLVKLAEEYQNQEVLRTKVREIVAELEASGAKSLNRTDKECTRIHGLEGTQAGYLTELVVDEKEGLIVSSDVVAENNDRNQFAGQVEKAHDVLGKKCGVACADSGYWKTEELEKVDQQDIRVVVPSQRQVAQRERDPFDKWQFRYERERIRVSFLAVPAERASL
jgi:transposase